MTRYIVADELLDVLNSQACADWLSEQEEYTPASIVEHALETLPTVEAIPIPFIWDFMDHIEEEIAQTDDSDPRMPGLCARHNALNALLRAWKEEEGKR